MKKNSTQLIIAAFLLLFSISAFANTVIVKGNVKDANGNPVAGRTVKITTDTMVNTVNCFIAHAKVTNANGAYADTLTCNGGDIKKLRIYTEGCNGALLINDLVVTSANVVESNFTICAPPPPPVTVPVTCNALFNAERTSPKKVVFNSSVSVTVPGDSIIKRVWSFGDGTSITTNDVKVVKEYPSLGIYNACLKIKTAKGCEKEFCRPVIVQDSVMPPPAGTGDAIKIISTYPNPVHNKMATVTWSRNNNVTAEISIVDVYGQTKWKTTKTLMQGNNVIEVNTTFLLSGPYFFKVTSGNSKTSKAFYKF